MSRTTPLVVFTTALAALATQVEAREMPAFIDIPTEEVAMAVHLPTGCMARVALTDGRLFAAHIVDTLCLPKGVSERSIPARANDFQLVDSLRK